MICEDCGQRIHRCDKCNAVLGDFACVQITVSGKAAKQMKVAEGTPVGQALHYCRRCVITDGKS